MTQEETFKKFIDFIQNKVLDNSEPEFEHGILGIVTEAGELADILKRFKVYKKPLDLEHIKEELGDTLHYMIYILNKFGWNLDDLMNHNMNKLKKRYPDGYSNKDALVRADKE